MRQMKRNKVTKRHDTIADAFGVYKTAAMEKTIYHNIIDHRGKRPAMSQPATWSQSILPLARPASPCFPRASTPSPSTTHSIA